jgi:hypothetical protein
MNELEKLAAQIQKEMNKQGFVTELREERITEEMKIIQIFIAKDFKNNKPVYSGWVCNVHFYSNHVRLVRLIREDNIEFEYCDPEFPQNMYARVKELGSM